MDGLVYAIGGQHNQNEDMANQAQVDAFIAVTDRLHRVADLPVARGHITASVLVLKGRLVVLGGTEPGKRASSAVTAYEPRDNL